MTAKTAHTPGPWRVYNFGDGGPGLMVAASDEAETYVAQCDNISASAISKEQMIANARRIVACVNACEGIANPEAVGELVEACQLVIAAYGRTDSSQPTMLALAIKSTLAALAKAGVK